jgi:hypothetical protein
MATYFRNALHLADMPPWTNSGDLYRTFNSENMSVETLQINDTNGNGQIVVDTNNTGYETIGYDVGSGAETEEIVRSVYARATVELQGGGTLTNVNVHVFQTDSGVTFLNEFGESGQLDNLAIESITITSIVVDNFSNADMASSLSGTVVCFAEGTELATPEGLRRVETLRPGDLVWTRDHGPRAIAGVLKDADAGQGQHAPITFAPGSIGPGLPARSLSVSPQHRILCASPLVQRMFGVPEAFLPALRFLGCPGVSQDTDCDPVTYYHINLSEHAILYAEAAPVESCLLGSEMLRTSPDLARMFGFQEFVPCRMIPKGHMQHRFVERLGKNKHAIFLGEAAPAFTQILPEEASAAAS